MSNGTLHIELDRQTARNGKAEWAVLGKFNLVIPHGQRLAIMGANGCGKTTLLRLICGLVKPTSGKIALDNLAVTGPSRRCGMMFQDHGLLPWMTVMQNIAFGQANRDPEAVMAQMARMDLVPYADLWPHQLSGGMAQRVALARALIAQPKILCLDEPFAALDLEWRRKLNDDLKHAQAQSNQSMIVVTHDPADAQSLCERLIILGGTPTHVQVDRRL